MISEGGAIDAVLGGLLLYRLRLRLGKTGARLWFSLRKYKPFVSASHVGLFLVWATTSSECLSREPVFYPAQALALPLAIPCPLSCTPGPCKLLVYDGFGSEALSAGTRRNTWRRCACASPPRAGCEQTKSMLHFLPAPFSPSPPLTRYTLSSKRATPPLCSYYCCCYYCCRYRS